MKAHRNLGLFGSAVPRRGAAADAASACARASAASGDTSAAVASAAGEGRKDKWSRRSSICRLDTSARPVQALKLPPWPSAEVEIVTAVEADAYPVVKDPATMPRLKLVL